MLSWGTLLKKIAWTMERLGDPVSRFRLSIRLEASRRVLRKEWWRQLVVWVMSFAEVTAVTIVPGLHLVTSPYVTMAVLLLMVQLSCWRAGSFVDPFLHPVHVLRPKHYSRFGLGEHQRACSFFGITSLGIRLACSVAYTGIFLLFVVYRVEPILCTERSLVEAHWAYYYKSEIDSDLKTCNAQSNNVNSTACRIIRDFERRCHDPAWWSEHLRKQALEEVGLACDRKTHEVTNFAPFLAMGYIKAQYCMAANGTQFNCTESAMPMDTKRDLDLGIWTSGEITLDQVCTSWPPAPFQYYCNILFDSTGFCSSPDEKSLVWGSILSRSCELHECAALLSDWLQDTLVKSEKLNLCDCKSCKHWSRTTICTLEEVDIANRRRAGLPEYISLDIGMMAGDPWYGVQVFAVMLMVAWPLIWCFASAMFCCCSGNPFAVPSNAELQESIVGEEVALRNELRSNGYIARSPGFNRLFMLIELGFFVADIILDCQMFWLYQDRQHYWFAAAQGFIILRTIIDLALNHVVCSYRLLADIWHSFRTNLRTDSVLLLVQSEKTGEAVLSMFLQVYGLFYVTDHTSYWTASLSLILSAGGITYGCYIYFDLAVVFGETCAEIVPSQEAAIELEPAQVESPISSPPQAPPMMSVEPVSKGNKDKLEVHNAEKFQDEIKAFITQNSKVVPAQAENPQGAAPTLVGASSSFSIIIPRSSSTMQHLQ